MLKLEDICSDEQRVKFIRYVATSVKAQSVKLIDTTVEKKIDKAEKGGILQS